IMYTSVGFVPCNGQHITSQHPPEYRALSQVHQVIDYTQRMERKELTLSFHNLIKRDEELYGYTNYGMETPTPSTTPGDCLPGLFQTLDSLSPTLDSEFDVSLAVPESLSVIDDKTKEETDAVHDAPIKFSSVHRKVFIPGVVIKVRFVENERSVTTHLLNPNLYTISLKHGDFTWTIKKRYKHILYLHQQLSLYRTSLDIPFPTKTHRTRRASFKNTVTEETAERVALDAVAVPRSNSKKRDARPRVRKGALPRFPKKPEVMITYEGIQLRMHQLEEYLYNLLNISIYRNHHETVKFLEVSNLSFISELGTKGKEGMIQKRTGSTRPGQAGCNCFGMLGNMWQERWFFVKDTFFGYIRPRDGIIKAIMLFDQGYFRSINGHVLNGPKTRSSCAEPKQTDGDQMLDETQEQRMVAVSQKSRDFTHPNVHYSFAPNRGATPAATFVDGSAYLSAAADAMELAREEIFIADWRKASKYL
ncbi:Phospholipase D1, partial [Operophtera brumata]